MWAGRTNIPDRCCQRPARFWDRLSTLGLPSRLCAAGPIDRFVLPQSPSRSRRREIGFSSERTCSARIDCVLLDGRADTPVKAACDFRRKLDTFLSPKCCKAQDMAVCASCDGPRLWNSGSTARRPGAPALFPKIPTGWEKDGFPVDALRAPSNFNFVADLRRSPMPRQRLDFGLAGLRSG